jgi:hypothetical protein
MAIKNGTVLFIHRSVGNIFEPKQMKREGNDKIEPSRLLGFRFGSRLYLWVLIIGKGIGRLLFRL